MVTDTEKSYPETTVSAVLFVVSSSLLLLAVLLVGSHLYDWLSGHDWPAMSFGDLWRMAGGPYPHAAWHGLDVALFWLFHLPASIVTASVGLVLLMTRMAVMVLWARMSHGIRHDALGRAAMHVDKSPRMAQIRQPLARTALARRY